MPKIPVLSQQQRLNPQNPTGFQGTGGARLFGESLKAAGTGVSNIGKALERVEGANKSLAKQEADTMVRNGLADLQRSYRESGYSPERGQQFDKDRERLIKTVTETLSNKYGKDYTGLISIQAGATAASGRGAIENLNEKQKIAFVSENKDKMISTFNASAYTDPDSVLDQTLKAEQIISDLNQQMGASPEQITMETRTVREAIARSAVDGLMAQGRFDDAKKLVTGSRFKDSFNTDEQRAEIDRINAREVQAANITYQNQHRAELKAEKDLKKSQEMATMVVMSEIQKAAEQGDGQMAARLMDQVQRDPSKVGLSNLGKLKTSFDKGMKESSSIHRFNIVGGLLSNMGEGSFEKAESDVWREINEGDLLPSVGMQMLKEIDALKKKSASDPKYKQEVKAGKLILDSFILSEDLDITLYGTQGASRQDLIDRNSRRKAAEAAYVSATLTAKEDGLTPEQIAYKIAADYAPEAFRDNPPVPLEGFTPYQPGEKRSDYVDRLEAHYNYKEKYSSSKTRKRMIKAYIEQQKIRSKMEAVQEAAIKNESYIQSKPVVDEIFRDLDQTLRSEDANGIPYIYRTLEGGF